MKRPNSMAGRIAPTANVSPAGAAPAQKVSRLARILLLIVPLAFAPPLRAGTDNPPDAVTAKGDQLYCLRGDQLELATEEVKLPFDIVASTNGTFKVDDGKERKLQDGQLILRFGWLLNPDGSIQPVFDHIAMKDGKVIVVRDGKAEALTEWKTFPNNLRIGPDGSCVYPSGANTRLADGQLFRLDGTVIPAKDTITFKNGRVVVLKRGALIPLAPIQIMGMCDGTRVNGTGLITRPDGTTSQLSEGQTVLFDGAAARN